jgi:hypothetical protein
MFVRFGRSLHIHTDLTWVCFHLFSMCRYALTNAFLVAFVLTFFSIFDVPVFWPILLLYWLVLFVLTMKRQIRHMIKYRYVPFTVGKQVMQFQISFKVNFL